MSLTLVPLNDIHSTDPVDRNTDDFLALTDSIRRFGVLQPVLLAEDGPSRYTLIHGNRRLAAAKEADLFGIPALVRKMNKVQRLEAKLACDSLRDTRLTARRMRELLQLDPSRTFAQLAALIGKTEFDVLSILNLGNLIAEADHTVPAVNAIHLGKLHPDTQWSLLEQAQTMEPKAFAALVKDQLGKEKSHKRATSDRKPCEYASRPRVRKLRELVDELQNPSAFYRLITPEMDAKKAFAQAIIWAMCIDRDSILERAAADAARRKKSLEFERIIREERQRRQEEERQYQGDRAQGAAPSHAIQ